MRGEIEGKQLAKGDVIYRVRGDELQELRILKVRKGFYGVTSFVTSQGYLGAHSLGKCSFSAKKAIKKEVQDARANVTFYKSVAAKFARKAKALSRISP